MFAQAVDGIRLAINLPRNCPVNKQKLNELYIFGARWQFNKSDNFGFDGFPRWNFEQKAKKKLIKTINFIGNKTKQRLKPQVATNNFTSFAYDAHHAICTHG